MLYGSTFLKASILTIFTFIISLVSAFAQDSHQPFQPTYNEISRRTSRSPIKLSESLTGEDSSQFQKAFNIYHWITHNIAYDVKGLHDYKRKPSSLEKILRQKKGLCNQYTDLYIALCQNAGISTKEILGYTRGSEYQEDDRFYETDHSWIGIKLDSTWFLVDPTWGSGGLQQKNQRLRRFLLKAIKIPYINDRYKFIASPTANYFLIPPRELISDHLPADPSWQLLTFPIAVKTFETRDWGHYKGLLDSNYPKTVDSAAYLEILDKYEYLSDLQYSKITAEKSQEYNPINHRLVGISSFNMAVSQEHVYGDNQQKLGGYTTAKQSYSKAIGQLRNHQRIVKNESNLVIKKTKSRISKELTTPLKATIKSANRDIRESTKFKNQFPQKEHSIKNQISSSKIKIGKVSLPFKKPQAAPKVRIDIVEKNESKLRSNQLELSSYQDSLMNVSRRIDSLSKIKRSTQIVIANHYQQLPILSQTSIDLISNNSNLSLISRMLFLMDSTSSIINNSRELRKSLDREIQQQKRIVNQLQSLIVLLSNENQNLVIQNCQYSGLKNCQDSIYHASNLAIRRANLSRLKVDQQLLDNIRYDKTINQDLYPILKELSKLLTVNHKFIKLYEKRRIQGILFKQKRSYYQTNELIRASQKRIKHLTTTISKIKKDIKNDDTK